MRYTEEKMQAVDLSRIQDFTQQNPLPKAEKSESRSGSDFLSMLNSNLNTTDEPLERQPVQNSYGAEKESCGEKSDSVKEDKRVSAEKDFSEKTGKKVSDSILQGAVFAGAASERGVQARNSVQNTEVLQKKTEKNNTESGKKIHSKNVRLNFSDNKNGGAEKISDSEIAFLKDSLLKSKSLKENLSPKKEATDSESLSAGELLTAQIVSSENPAEFLSRIQEGASVSGKDGAVGNARPAKSAGEKNGKITVTDLRSKVADTNIKSVTEDNIKNDMKKVKDFAVSVKEVQAGNVEMTLDMTAAAEKNILGLDNQSAAADGSAFQAMLKNQITQNAEDFVRAGNIILRDNNQGQINLILHPESLGNVKISLDMSGKVVTGHITVASREAFDAFGDSANALKNAFIQSGFEDARFDISYSGQNQMNFAQSQNGQGGQQEAARQGRKIYGDFVQESLTSTVGTSDKYNSASDYEVNIVA